MLSNMVRIDDERIATGKDFDPQTGALKNQKVRLLDDGHSGEGLHVEAGTVRDVAYVGMVTRYLVELEGGGELQVVRQNLETSSQEAQELRGRRVRVAWHEAQTFAIDEVQSREEGPP